MSAAKIHCAAALHTPFLFSECSCSRGLEQSSNCHPELAKLSHEHPRSGARTHLRSSLIQQTSWCRFWNERMKHLLADGCAAQDINSDTRLEVMRPPSCSTTSGRTASQTSSLSSSTWSKCCISPADSGACPILRPAIHHAALTASLSQNSRTGAGSRQLCTCQRPSWAQGPASCLHYGVGQSFQSMHKWVAFTREDISNQRPPQSFSNLQGSGSILSAGHLPHHNQASPGRGHAAHKGACGACAAGQNGPRKGQGMGGVWDIRPFPTFKALQATYCSACGLIKAMSTR